MRTALVRVGWIAAVAYSLVHIYVSGVRYPLSSPNVGQVVEELQPLYRLWTTGEATVDHPRQYGPVFLMLLHPVYRLDLEDPTLLAWYAYALGVAAIAIGLVATLLAARVWLRARGATLTPVMVLAVVLLWANFSPLYGVLAIKNVEIWELATMAVAGLALLRNQPALAGWAVAAGALMKMLPFVFFPYLWLRDRKAFVHGALAMVAILTLSQMLYGTAMGWGYFGSLVNAAASAEGFGNPRGMIWHENVSLRGVITKGFGYLESPRSHLPADGYTRGYHVVVPDRWQPVASVLSSGFQLAAMAWVAWVLFRRRRDPEPARTYWDWALVLTMMLVLAPQISQDYMVLTLGAFSFVLVGCIAVGRRGPWVEFVLAAILVGNIIPRGAFAALIGIGPARAFAGYEHLMLAEVYQYFGFPLLGLLLLMRAWVKLAQPRPAVLV